MNPRTVGSVALAGLCLAAGVAPGQEPAEQPVRKRIEPVVQTATKMESSAEQITAAFSVITGEEIESKHYQTVGDALRAVPGVQIQRAGGLGKLTTARIRGANPNQIQVLIDGARVDSATQGDFDFSDISTDLIDRIEIIRGPQSTLYGADAIGGVINIITRKGSGPLGGSLSLEGGSFNTARARGSAGGAWRQLDYSLFASGFSTTGQQDNDGADQVAAGGQLGLNLPLNTRISIMGRYSRSDSDLPVDTVVPLVLDPDSHQRTDFGTVTLQLEQKAFPWWEHRLALHGMLSRIEFRDGPQPVPSFGSTRSRLDSRRGEIEWVNAFRPVTWNTLTLGVEHRRETGEGRSEFRVDDQQFPTRFSETITNTALFGQDEVTLFERVVLTGGLRYDINSPFESVLTPRVGAAVLLKETGSKVRGGWGKGFRAPTINDLFFPGAGNPDLQPERSESWEVGVDQRLWAGRARLGATYFNTRFQDLIQFDLVAFKPINVARARVQGVEVTAEVDVLPWLVLTGSYTYTDTEDLDTGQPLRRFAPHSGSIGLTAEPIRRLTLFVQAYLTSSQFEVPRDNPGYIRIDVGGDYRVVERAGLWPALTAYLRIQNLTDRQYDEVLGFRAPGINVLGGLRASY